MTIINSFIKQFIAIIKGDDAEILANKVWRQADTAFQIQILALKRSQMQKQYDMECANEELEKALVNNGKEILEGDQYIINLISAKEKVKTIQKELIAYQETLKFLNEQYTLLKSE